MEAIFAYTAVTRRNVIWFLESVVVRPVTVYDIFYSFALVVSFYNPVVEISFVEGNGFAGLGDDFCFETFDGDVAFGEIYVVIEFVCYGTWF